MYHSVRTNRHTAIDCRGAQALRTIFVDCDLCRCVHHAVDICLVCHYVVGNATRARCNVVKLILIVIVNGVILIFFKKKNHYDRVLLKHGVSAKLQCYANVHLIASKWIETMFVFFFQYTQHSKKKKISMATSSIISVVFRLDLHCGAV